jgi:hypothetical protein
MLFVVALALMRQQKIRQVTTLKPFLYKSPVLQLTRLQIGLIERACSYCKRFAHLQIFIGAIS